MSALSIMPELPPAPSAASAAAVAVAVAVRVHVAEPRACISGSIFIFNEPVAFVRARRMKPGHGANETSTHVHSQDERACARRDQPGRLCLVFWRSVPRCRMLSVFFFTTFAMTRPRSQSTSFQFQGPPSECFWRFSSSRMRSSSASDHRGGPPLLCRDNGTS